jgi:hypothetical protein
VFLQLAVWLSCVDKKKGHELITRRRRNSPHQDQKGFDERPHYLIKSSIAFFIVSGMSVALNHICSSDDNWFFTTGEVMRESANGHFLRDDVESLEQAE